MMQQALKDAGFPGVEEDAGVIHARLSDAITPFRADPVGTGWRLSLCWPLRPSPVQMADWNATHPEAPMDLWQGEAQMSFTAQGSSDLAPDLARWAALAEAAMAQMIRWRRAQRAPGEGM